jgi:hypothetical protein
MKLDTICGDALLSHQEHTKQALDNLCFKRFASRSELENAVKKIVENVPFEIEKVDNQINGGDYLYNIEINYISTKMLFEVYYLLDCSQNIVITEVNHCY